ncbi:hypothetical protein ACQQ97_02410 [Anaerovoracaceae bacterium SGI.195]
MNAYRKEKLNILIKAIREYFAYDKKKYDKMIWFGRISREIRKNEPEPDGFYEELEQYSRICTAVNKAKHERKRLIKLDKWKLRWHIKRAFKEFINAEKEDENIAN